MVLPGGEVNSGPRGALGSPSWGHGSQEGEPSIDTSGNTPGRWGAVVAQVWMTRPQQWGLKGPLLGVGSPREGSLNGQVARSV